MSEADAALIGLGVLKKLATQLRSGAGWFISRDDLVPEDKRGEIAQHYWNDSMFSYGMEYGMLAALALFEQNSDNGS
jgi:hypothetical protein